ncbi:MAG: hypothetical protein ACJAUG_001719 [Halioglobus sp.]|jgi:hypothetical protein
MDPLYDVCFAGEILPGQDLDTVKLKFAKLFKTDDATLAKLFSGKTQLLKRGCDRQTALKYKKAVEQAGAKPVIRTSASEPTAQSPKPTPAAPAPEPPKLTAAERIALLAAAPDISSAAPPEAPATSAVAEAAAVSQTDEGATAFDLAPVGTDVLRPNERSAQATSNIKTSGIELMPVGVDLSEAAIDSSKAPDVSHLSMGEVGEDIPTLPQTHTIVAPDISAIALSPADTDFSDCAAEPAAEPELDLSAIELAPSGADLLDGEYRKESEQVAPKTDHLSLQE